MTPDDVIAIFERLNIEGRATVPVGDACAGFAGWLSSAWEALDGESIALLTSVGAALYREGLDQRERA
jgi:hypothetical protein